MIDFRPHTLRIVSTEKGHYKETIVMDGTKEVIKKEWIEGKKIMSNPTPCRYEQNGKAQTIILTDGKVCTYSLVVYLDLSDVDYPVGTTIQLFDSNNKKVFEKKVEGFRKGQLNMTIWI